MKLGRREIPSCAGGRQGRGLRKDMAQINCTCLWRFKIWRQDEIWPKQGMNGLDGRKRNDKTRETNREKPVCAG